MEQAYIGPGRAIDPDKYFVIIANQIGNGLSSSPHNTPAPFNGLKFPHVRISDDVRAQHRLITEKFGIERLELVMGGSTGAPQTYEWAVRYPEMVKRATPIAGNPKVTSHEFVFLETLKEAITTDLAWQGAWYTEPHTVHQGLCKQRNLHCRDWHRKCECSRHCACSRGGDERGIWRFCLRCGFRWSQE
jgi:homoserine O-acetyltransferase/O-succinyltransferase